MNFRGLTLVVFLVLFSTSLYGQNSTFTGHVTDSSGAVVPKAQIKVHNQETGVTVTTTTAESGNYTVPYLAPGHYSVSAETEGFKKENKTNITLQVSQTAVIKL